MTAQQKPKLRHWLKCTRKKGRGPEGKPGSLGWTQLARQGHRDRSMGMSSSTTLKTWSFRVIRKPPGLTVMGFCFKRKILFKAEMSLTSPFIFFKNHINSLLFLDTLCHPPIMFATCELSTQCSTLTQEDPRRDAACLQVCPVEKAAGYAGQSFVILKRVFKKQLC